MLQRDFDEKVSSKMKAAMLITIPPTDLRDSLIQKADKFVELPAHRREGDRGGQGGDEVPRTPTRRTRTKRSTL